MFAQPLTVFILYRAFAGTDFMVGCRKCEYQAWGKCAGATPAPIDGAAC
jgi:cobalamin biosynthesis protein CobD/CbiB